jgi:hypothetical protein
MPEPSSFEYAVVRVVPFVEREEFLNVGVILYCREQRFLDACIELDSKRLMTLSPVVDLEMVEAELALIPRICAGGTGAGSIGQMDQAERFRWLTSARSSTIQTSPVHCGMCSDPAMELARIVNRTLLW